MSKITWDQIATPDFRGANDLFIRSNQQYQDAIKGLADTLRGVQTEVRAQNDAKILDYINQATSAEQLQSPEFRTGYQNLIGSLGNEYDVQGAAKVYDGRTDILNQRANALLDQQRLQQTIKLGDQTYNQNETKFNNEQLDRGLTQNTLDWFTTTDPIVKESLLVKGIDPELVQKLQTGDLNIQKLRQGIDQDAEMFPKQLKAAELENTGLELRNKGQKLKNQAQESENKVTDAQTNAFVQLNGLSERSPNFNKNAQSFNAALPRIAQYDNDIIAAADRFGLDRNLLRGLIMAESSGNPNAKSPVGARGLGQIVRGTRNEILKQTGIDAYKSPQENILASAYYLSQRMKDNKGDVAKALAGYNAGQGRVNQYGGVPPFKETKDYIQRIGDYVTIARTGNDGTNLSYPDGMNVTGRSGSTGQQSAAQIQKAYENSPQGIIGSFTKSENELKAKSFTAPGKDFGGGTYKNPTEWSTAMKGEGTNAMISNMMDVTRKTNFKFSDKTAEKAFNKDGVKNWNKLNDAQKAGVLERAYTNIVNQNGKILGERTFMVGDKDLVQFQKAIQAETDSLLSEPKKAYERSLDANRLNTLTRLVNQHGYSPEQAAQAMKLDTATVQRLLGVQQPKSPDPVQAAAQNSSKQLNWRDPANYANGKIPPIVRWAN